MKKIVSRTLTSIFFALFLYYFITHTADFKVLFDISPLTLILVITGHIGAILTNSLFTRSVVKHFNKDITYSKSILSTILGAIGNFFMPVGSGTSLKAVYLKKHTELSYSNFVSFLSANYIFVFLINSGIGLVTLVLIKNFVGGAAYLLLATTFSVILIGCIALLTFKIPKTVSRYLADKKDIRVFKILNEVIKGWEIIKTNKILTIKLIFYVLLNFVALGLITYGSFLALGINLPFAAILLYSALAALSLLLNFTPGSIGIRESIYLLLASTFSLLPAVIISASLIDRGVRLIILGISWAIFHYREKQININKSLLPKR